MSDCMIMQSGNRSPRIKQVSWGRLEVEGRAEPYKDAKLFPGGSREWNWRDTGMAHRPGIQTADAPEFDPIPKPGPDDWLSVHPESGQTFDDFKASGSNRPTHSRHIIYLQPLGEFAADHSPSIEKLREFAAAFFAMKVNVLPAV